MNKSTWRHFFHFHNRPITKFFYTCVSVHLWNCIPITYSSLKYFSSAMLSSYFSSVTICSTHLNHDQIWLQAFIGLKYWLLSLLVPCFLKKFDRSVHSNLLFMYVIKYFIVYQFFFQDNRSLKGKFLAYFDLHNRLSSLCLVLPSYLLFYVGLILRFVLTDLTDFSAAR